MSVRSLLAMCLCAGVAHGEMSDNRLRFADDGPGIEYESADGDFFINGWLRSQFRFSDPVDSDPRTSESFANLPGSELEVRRLRLRAAGHLFSPRIGFNYEHDLLDDLNLLDLRLDISVRDDLELRVGQFKVQFNRERVDSSGKQQLIDRSIANYAFTVDRQRGLTLAKRVGAETSRYSWLYLGVYEGDGREPGPRGDDPMLMARWQWHFLGAPLPFSQSDYAMTETAAGTFSVAALRVRGPYTRFSSSGGGQLVGFEPGSDDRYTLEQFVQEFAWRLRGLSVQQELHVKRIRDNDTGRRSRLTGGYVNVGKVWPLRLGQRDVPFELAARLAHVDWDDTPADRTQDEYTLGANLFFAGHNNKLTFDVSRLELDDAGGSPRDTRFRFQWDISF